MSYPHIIAIDSSSYEDNAHPVAIAWSLSDGSIKTTLIQPEDDWHDWDSALEEILGISQETLHQRGETSWSILRELEQDLEQPLLLSDDIDRTHALLEKIYDACQREMSVEIDCYSEHVPGDTDVHSLAEDIRDTLQLDQQLCEDRVHLILEIWARSHSEDE